MSAFDWPALFTPPAGLSEATAGPWFDTLASQLLNRSRLIVGGKPHRFMEVEAYYHGPWHADPFAHRDPMQLHVGRWYFHRTGGVYRGGSFKGVDLAFGDGTAHAGFLVRGIEKPDGTLIDGPSMTVDYLLATTGHKTVALLDAACGANPVWQPGATLGLATGDDLGHPVFTCARVGLGLKKRKHKPDDPAFRFLFRRYRYLAEPTRTGKGKPLMALARLAEGKSPEEVATAVGSPLSALKRYAADLATGRAETDPTPYYGKDLSTAELCRLHGLWNATHPA